LAFNRDLPEVVQCDMTLNESIDVVEESRTLASTPLLVDSDSHGREAPKNRPTTEVPSNSPSHHHTSARIFGRNRFSRPAGLICTHASTLNCRQQDYGTIPNLVIAVLVCMQLDNGSSTPFFAGLLKMFVNHKSRLGIHSLSMNDSIASVG